MAALDTKSPYTAGHSKSVSDMVEILCRLLGLNRMMHIAAHLHDIVKIGMKTHPQIGANILDKSHLLAPFSKIVLHHHERYGLNGKETPLGLRIIALCDSIDTMT